jgi:ribonuclease Z
MVSRSHARQPFPAAPQTIRFLPPMPPLRLAVLAAVLSLSCLSAQAFDGIRVTLLATGTPEAPASGPGPSTLVEAGDEVLLFDCGPGTRQRLQQANVALRDVTALFLSTLDARRTAGCAELWRDRAALGADALPVWGPAGTAELVGNFERSASLAPQSAVLGFDIGDNVVYQPEAVTVTAFVTDSGPDAQSFGYRVDAMRRAVTLSGSTRYSENVVRYAKGAHLLVHEVAAAAASGNASELQLLTQHTSPEDAARVFRTARPYLAVYSQLLLLGATPEDVVRRTRSAYRGALEVGRDLMVIEIQNEVQVRGAPSEPRAGDAR